MNFHNTFLIGSALLLFSINIHAQDWKSISKSQSHVLVIKKNGTLWGWGWNKLYQLVIEDIFPEIIPVNIHSNYKWKSVICGAKFYFLLNKNNTLFTVCINKLDSLVDSTNINKSFLTKVISKKNMVNKLES